MPVALRNQQRLLRVATPRLKKLAAQALVLLGAPDADLSLALVDDTMIRRLNRDFHHTDRPTDVLAFDYGAGQGEIIISLERAVAHARRYRVTPSCELARYVIHGLLHLHGHEDRTPAQRRQMRAAERRLLRRLAAEVPLCGLVRSAAGCGW